MLLVSVTSLYVTEIKTNVWPGGHENVVGFAGQSVMEFEADPLWPAVTFTLPLSSCELVNLLFALGHWLPPFRQPQVAVAVVWAVIVDDAPAPSPAILNDVVMQPVPLLTLELQFMKCAFWANTGTAMKPAKATMARVRILNRFIILLLF
jgi:hypothetical protein